MTLSLLEVVVWFVLVPSWLVLAVWFLWTAFRASDGLENHPPVWIPRGVGRRRNNRYKPAGKKDK